MKTDSPARSLKAFVADLDRALSAREMHAAARRAGYATTMAAIHTARTVLGVAKSRSNHERKTAPKQSLPPISTFKPPSDEAILEHLIVKVGLDRAQRVFDRVASLVDLDTSASNAPRLRRSRQ
jgi:hypothetical protein